MYNRFFKRFFDILFSGLALIILSLLMLILAILVRINLGGPVIYKHARIGKGGKMFMLYKFRSMTTAKDKDGNDLPDELRHTKFGKLLRSTSLDELPQLWNVFKGDMSIIGPRPTIPKDMLFFTKYYHGTDVRPGITGYHQTHGRNGVTWTKRLNSDNYYVDHMSFWLDIKILFLTVVVVLKRSNIDKEQYFYYCDEMLDKGLVTQAEYDAYLLKARELSARCGMGETIIVQDYALNKVHDVAVPSTIVPYKEDKKSA